MNSQSQYQLNSVEREKEVLNPHDLYGLHGDAILRLRAAVCALLVFSDALLLLANNLLVLTNNENQTFNMSNLMMIMFAKSREVINKTETLTAEC